MFKPSFRTGLREIINLLNCGKISGSGSALEKFKVYIAEIKDLGSFNSIIWESDWRLMVYEFGAKFEKVNPGEFLNELKKISETTTPEQQEVIDFINSEIEWNFFSSDRSYVRNYLKSLINLYPTNPEFHNSYSHFCEDHCNYEKAVAEALIALKIEPSNNEFIKSYVNKEKKRLDNFLKTNDVVNAKIVIDKVLKFLEEGKYDDPTFVNIFILQLDRLNDHEIFNKKIKEGERLINAAVESSQSRMIEILGIFAAVIALIFTTTNLVLSSLLPIERLLILLSLAIVLLIFAVSISYLFKNNYRNTNGWQLIKRPKFVALICLLFLLIVIGIIEYKIMPKNKVDDKNIIQESFSSDDSHYVTPQPKPLEQGNVGEQSNPSNDSGKTSKTSK